MINFFFTNPQHFFSSTVIILNQWQQNLVPFTFWWPEKSCSCPERKLSQSNQLLFSAETNSVVFVQNFGQVVLSVRGGCFLGSNSSGLGGRSGFCPLKLFSWKYISPLLFVCLGFFCLFCFLFFCPDLLPFLENLKSLFFVLQKAATLYCNTEASGTVSYFIHVLNSTKFH